MLKMTRLAALAAVVLVAVSAAIVPPTGHAQQPAPAAAPPAAAPAEPAAAPAAAAAMAPKAAAKTTEVVDNPYGLEALWKGGDMVAKITLAILVIMSVGSWYIIITKVYEQGKMGAQARAAEKNFWKAPSVQEGAAALKKIAARSASSPKPGIEATSKHTGLLEKVDMNEWITMSIQRAIDNVQSRTQDGLAFLATVGSTAPFVGLFGTVWGIYHALTAIGIAGQASIDKVAGPVGEALIMTAFGLAVAVPAVLGYNWLVRRNKTAMDRVRSFGADLHAVLLSTTPQDRRQGISRVDECRFRRRRGRGRLDHQYDAARRCDAGAADHLPDHHPGRHDVDPGPAAEGNQRGPRNASRRTSSFPSTRRAASTGTSSRSPTPPR